MKTSLLMSPPEVLRITVKVDLEHGMHMYPCSRITKLVNETNTNLRVIHGDRSADARSVLELIGLAAVHGTELVLEAEGEDAQETLNRLEHLFSIRFDPNQD